MRSPGRKSSLPHPRWKTDLGLLAGLILLSLTGGPHDDTRRRLSARRRHVGHTRIASASTVWRKRSESEPRACTSTGTPSKRRSSRLISDNAQQDGFLRSVQQIKIAVLGIGAMRYGPEYTRFTAQFRSTIRLISSLMQIECRGSVHCGHSKRAAEVLRRAATACAGRN